MWKLVVGSETARLHTVDMLKHEFFVRCGTTLAAELVILGAAQHAVEDRHRDGFDLVMAETEAVSQAELGYLVVTAVDLRGDLTLGDQYLPHAYGAPGLWMRHLNRQ